ncbi:large secreted protein [Kutzneria sp. CA-103260]|nr:large secreted protein [Kutzneria sp. CA-103260]
MSVLGLVAGITDSVPLPVSAAPIADSAKLKLPPEKSVPVTPVASHYSKPAPPTNWKPTKTTMPSGSGDVTIAASVSAKAAAPQTASVPVRLGKPAAKTAATTATTGGTAHVAVKPMPGGLDGELITVQRTDQTPGPIDASLTLDYSSFRDAVGGDWASRLRLVRLPDCVATTPDKPQCLTATPLTSTNDAKALTVSADVTLPASKTPMVLAATGSSTGNGSGDYSATSLKPSGSWSAGGSSDAFTWNYTMDTPPVPGGLEPNLGLSYDSQSADGLTSSTNNQASWVGDGWSYEPGFIERSYQSCHQNTDTATQNWDSCWTNLNTLTLSLGGHTSTLVPDDAHPGTYRPQGDDNEKVTYLTGGANTANNGEYWVITTSDGTKYYFGLNHLPGWKDSTTPATNSVQTEPVFATSAVKDDPQSCYKANFADSWCQQAYRWDLDYVVDPHGDTASYFYTPEVGYYARNKGTTADTPYTRGQYLTKIQYGQRDGAVYSTQPGGQVVFTSTPRCVEVNADPSAANACKLDNLKPANAADWPDVPQDLVCASGATCQIQSPTFFSEYLLTNVETDALVGAAEKPVDSWKLAYSFPPTGSNVSSSPWLYTITRQGLDTSNSGATSSSALPVIQFDGTGMANRVTTNGGTGPITRQRLSKITTETGEIIKVDYLNPGCDPNALPVPEHNQSLCYPVYWSPNNQPTPIVDWFNKYVVNTVTVTDPTGGNTNDTIETHYTPTGPAWHYDDSPLTPATPTNQHTWNDWRGFSGMTTSVVGRSPDPTTKTQSTYFQGMNGDTLPGNGSRPATVQDSRGDPAITDSDQFAGMTYEVRTFNGDALVSDTVTDPWTSDPTATHTLPDSLHLPALQAFHTGTADTKVYTPLGDGSTRKTETDNSFDQYGRIHKVNDLGDTATADDDLCTTTTYADNADHSKLDSPSEVLEVSASCDKTPVFPDNAVSDKRIYYDKSTTLGELPGAGDATKTEQAGSYDAQGNPVWVAQSTNTFDQYGRPLTATDADNRTTKTAYTPTDGAEPTAMSVTDPKGLTAGTTFDPLRDLPLSTTDAASYKTTATYDALGRIVTVRKPGINGIAVKYAYTVSNQGPSTVSTQTLNDDGSYRTAETLYDSLLRQRETQTQTPDNWRVITDTVYNSDGWVSYTANPYLNSSPVDGTLVQAQVADVPSSTGISYDGTGRKTLAVAYAQGIETWRTTYSYGGNTVTTTPPAGTAPSTTVADARGRTTDILRYHAGVTPDPVKAAASDYDRTHYTYYPSGKQASIVDPAGNTWSYTYDLMGNQLTVKDPDSGTTTSTYDNAGLLATTTDSRGKQVTTTYDEDGRRTHLYDTTSTSVQSQANMLAEWTYDSVKPGYPTGSTSYSNGDVYANQITLYNALGKPAKSKVTLTGEGTTLAPAGGFVTTYNYTATGNPSFDDLPTTPGMPGGIETVTYGYDNFGEPTSLKGDSDTFSTIYVSALGYSRLGQPVAYQMPIPGDTARVQLTYDNQTQALTDIKTQTVNGQADLDELSYSFSNSSVSKGAGLLLSTQDKQGGGVTVDQQCFSYDYASRLAGAWSALDDCSATPKPSASPTVGGPNPYWQTWTYNAAGDRATQTDHDVTGNTANDNTTTYHYPTAQPNTLADTTTTGPNSAAQTASYTYDAAGNTKTITGGATGDQALVWDTLGHLSTDTTATGGSSYVYGADGNLVVRRDPGRTTLFLGDQQLVLDTKANAVTTTRYYTLGGLTVASRTGSGPVQYLIPDRQGTDQLAMDANTGALTSRQFLPFGQARGAAGLWPGGDKGYVGGTPDDATQLENLGAREYDPADGRFLSLDPMLEATDPNQLNGYDYAGNNPVTGSDPNGLLTHCPDDDCSHGLNGDPSQKDVDPIAPVWGTTGSDNWCNPFCGNKTMSTDPIRKVPLWRKINQAILNEAWNGRPKPVYTYFPGKTHGEFPEPGGAPADVDPAAMLGGIAGIVAGIAEATGCAAATEGFGLLVCGGNAVNTGLNVATSVSNGLAPVLRGCNSFAADTPVLMADGSTKPIQDVKVGDEVTDKAPGSADTAHHRVTAIHVTDTDTDFVSLSVGTANGAKTITVTAHHLFWDATTHRWTAAADLNPGDQLDTGDAATATVRFSWRFTSSVRTYNLTVADLHTYYVTAGTTPLLVHNDECKVNPKPGPAPDGSTLEQYADANRGANQTSTPDFVTEYTSPSGQRYYGRTYRVGDPDTNEELKELLDDWGCRSTCSEVSAVNQAENAEGIYAMRGGTFRTLRVRPLGSQFPSGTPADPCEKSCQSMIRRLGGRFK